jgi:DNA-binding SARP family transcriptional activator
MDSGARSAMLELRLLGASDLTRRLPTGEAFVHLQPKRFGLLSYLAVVSATKRCRRDTLLALFWADHDQPKARNALNQSLHGLRETLGSTHVVVSVGREELGIASDELWCDASAFLYAWRAEDYASALDLYHGDLLNGFHLEIAPEFDYWLCEERERFKRIAVDSARRMAGREVAEENPSGAARWLERLIEIDPDDECAVRSLLEMLDRMGDRPGALRIFERFERRLHHDLDLRPGQETIDLVEQIISSGPVDRSGSQDQVAIAVLPFLDLSPDRDQSCFCEGMTEEVTNALSHVSGPEVAAVWVAPLHTDRTFDLDDVARTRRVSYVLEGSVRRSGAHLRLTIHLIRVPGGFCVTSRTYDRDMGDPLAIQTEVAGRIVEDLWPAISLPDSLR